MLGAHTTPTTTSSFAPVRAIVNHLSRRKQFVTQCSRPPPGSVIVDMQRHRADACSDKNKLLKMYDDFKAKGFAEVVQAEKPGTSFLQSMSGHSSDRAPAGGRH